jgi:uncharacterized membrane protein
MGNTLPALLTKSPRRLAIDGNVANVVDDYKNKTSKKRLKIKRTKRYAMKKTNCLQFMFGIIVILVPIIIAMILPPYRIIG